MAIKEIFVFFACFSVLCRFDDCVNIECSFDTDSWVPVGHVYQCKLQNTLNIKTRESVEINSVNGSHLSGKSNSDVTCFISEYTGLVIEYFPRNLENIFKNLKMIWIPKGYLKEIKQSDLRPFSKLVRLDLDNNDIEFLEDGLFAYNPELELIHFSSNKIVHIGSQVFENLAKLTWLFLDSNICINMYAENNQPAVRKIISQAKIKCLSYTDIDNELQMLENSLLCVNSETLPIFDQKLQNLQSQFHNSTLSKYWSLKERFEAIIKWKSKTIWTVKDEVSIIESSVTNSTYGVLSQISNLKADLVTIKNSLANTDGKLTKVMSEIQQSMNIQSRMYQQQCININSACSEIKNSISDLKSNLNSKLSSNGSDTRTNDYKNLTGKDYLKYILIMLCLLLCLFNIVLIIIFKRFSM